MVGQGNRDVKGIGVAGPEVSAWQELQPTPSRHSRRDVLVPLDRSKRPADLFDNTQAASFMRRMRCETVNRPAGWTVEEISKTFPSASR